MILDVHVVVFKLLSFAKNSNYVFHEWNGFYFVDVLKNGDISVRIYRNIRYVDILKRYHK